MKKEYVINSVFAILLLIFGFNAFTPLRNINFDQYVVPGQNLEISLNVVNNLNYDFDDMKVRVYLLGTDEFTGSRTFDLDGKDVLRRKFILRIPRDIDNGDYLIKFTASNDEVRRSKYRYVTVV
jgi:uncharacterized membrane protein